LLKETAIQVAMMYIPLKFSSAFTKLLAQKKIITPISEYEKIQPVITKTLNSTKAKNMELALHK